MGTLEALLQGNHHQNRPALVMGSSPTVEVVSNFPFDGIRIGVGDMPVRAPEFGPYDYWVCANSYYPLPWNKKHQRDIENAGAKTLIASMSVLHSNDPDKVKFEGLREIFGSNYHILYEQRHFNQLPCDPRNICCDISAKFELGRTIQELLGHTSQNPSPAYSEGATVALHGYALAVLLRANPIYIAGVDLPTTTKSYRSFRHWFRPHEGFVRKIVRLCRDFVDNGNVVSDFGVAGQLNILNDFQLIAEVANQLGSKTYCLSEESPLLKLNGITKYSIN
jgi:hypothetical protein